MTPLVVLQEKPSWRSFFSYRYGSLLVTATLIAACIVAVIFTANPARATESTTTITSDATWIAPVGATGVTITAVGGGGGRGGNSDHKSGADGGASSAISGHISIKEKDVLAITVGGAGQNGNDKDKDDDGHGGTPYGGNGGTGAGPGDVGRHGGGGGGATVVNLKPAGSILSANIMFAGGGGGGGGAAGSALSTFSFAGAGGIGGPNNPAAINGHEGGDGASNAGGGIGNTAIMQAGTGWSAAAGNRGGGGGGGGGGYYGGNPGTNKGSAGGGGGAGGVEYLDPGVTQITPALTPNNNGAAGSTPAANGYVKLTWSVAEKSTTNISALPASFSYGDTISFLAEADDSAGNPIPGTIVVTDSTGTTVAGTTVTPGGPGTFKFTEGTVLAAGTYSQTVKFTPSDPENYTTSSGVVNIDVIACDTTTKITKEPATPVAGESVTLTATPSCTTTLGVPPTGEVTFKLGATGDPLSAALSADGVATLTTNALSAGDNSVSAQYLGDTNHGTSTGELTVPVTTGDVVVALGSVPTNSFANDQLTIPVTVSAADPATGVPTGTVTAIIDGKADTATTVELKAAGITTTALGAPAPLNTSTAVLQVSNLKAGAHTISASYAGDPNFNAGLSGKATDQVNKRGTRLLLTEAASRSTVGDPVTLTARVSRLNSGATPPSGVVTFTEGSVTLGTAVIGLNDTATLITKKIPAGTGTLTASYPGDENWLGSTDGGVVHTTAAATVSAKSGVSASTSQGGTLAYTGTALIGVLMTALLLLLGGVGDDRRWTASLHRRG